MNGTTLGALVAVVSLPAVIAVCAGHKRTGYAMFAVVAAAMSAYDYLTGRPLLGFMWALLATWHAASLGREIKGARK